MSKVKVRLLYEEHGAEDYYRTHAAEYSNPHEPQVRALLERNLHRLDCSGMVLDFAAGGGEVSAALQKLGAQNLMGCDPFTHALYEQKTKLPCLQLSFRDVLLNGLPQHYSLIVSSFAMHLCPAKDLYMLCWNLFQASPTLVIITPHKRPELELLPGIQLLWEDSVETEKGKKVRMKAYGMK